MNSGKFSRRANYAVVLAAMVLLGAGRAARAEDPDASFVEAVTTINGMVDHGVVSREAADAMITDAEKRAAIASALRAHGQPPASSGDGGGGVGAEGSGSGGGKSAGVPKSHEQLKREVMSEMKEQLVKEVKQEILAQLTGGGLATPGNDVDSGAAVTGRTKSRSLRVPYVPESVREEIHDQLKKEVLAQAREEKWGNPGALPDWIERIKLEGDLRVRYDDFRVDQGNTPAGVANYVSGTGLTRAADLVGANGNLSGAPAYNAQANVNDLRLRARVGATITLSDTATAGIRIATGSTSTPTSTNQTEGQGFDKYTVVLDRGFISVDPLEWLKLSGGRTANPFFSTDLVWADDLNFEGVNGRVTVEPFTNIKTSLTAGWFPLRTDNGLQTYNPLATTNRNLTGTQLLADWTPLPTIDLKTAVAAYNYHNIKGQQESNANYGPPSVQNYGSEFEYPATMRQRGNTLFIVNAPSVPLTGTTYWGLASGFRELDLTSSLDISSFDPLHIILTGDIVNNTAFNRNSIAKLTGSTIVDGSPRGYLGRILIGQPAMVNPGDWNATFTYRWVGSDSVLDAFDNSDFGFGGTNNKGYILTGSYGIDKNTWLTGRWMSSDLIDSYAPRVAGSSTPPTKFSVDLLELEVNSKF